MELNYKILPLALMSFSVLGALALSVSSIALASQYGVSSDGETMVDVEESITLLDRDVSCTMEAKECPDGSYVGRILPYCQFAPCPGTPALPDDRDLGVASLPGDGGIVLPGIPSLPDDGDPNSPGIPSLPDDFDPLPSAVRNNMTLIGDSIDAITDVSTTGSDNSSVHHIKGTRHARLFFFIPVTVYVELEVDGKTEAVTEIRKPWWSFLAW